MRNTKMRREKLISCSFFCGWWESKVYGKYSNHLPIFLLHSHSLSPLHLMLMYFIFLVNVVKVSKPSSRTHFCVVIEHHHIVSKSINELKRDYCSEILYVHSYILPTCYNVCFLLYIERHDIYVWCNSNQQNSSKQIQLIFVLSFSFFFSSFALSLWSTQLARVEKFVVSRWNCIALVTKKVDEMTNEVVRVGNKVTKARLATKKKCQNFHQLKIWFFQPSTSFWACSFLHHIFLYV